MSGYPETLTASNLCFIEGHLWRGGSCIRCYEQYRCLCGRFMKIEDMDEHFKTCPGLRKFQNGADPASKELV